MRYLWNLPLVMPNTKLLSVRGHEPHTPLDEAVQATLEGMSHLDGIYASKRPIAQSQRA